MANAQKGEITLEAGGETYRLAYTTNAMCELEDATGEALGKIVDKLNDPSNPPGVKTLRLLLWAALIEHQEEMTVKQAGGICDEIGMARVGEVIGEALTAAFPESSGGKPKASKQKSAG
ncbi:GTA-gp10 family protein [Sulfitobacter sp.]|uniref:GTA-gp10 family protein n=1 Tax=Sulfitobacter sp. TaxID=1903071 RepID=UPI003F6AE338